MEKLKKQLADFLYEIEDEHLYSVDVCNDIADRIIKILKANQLESQVDVKIADITKFITEWGALNDAPVGKYEIDEDKTLRRLIKALESNFSD